MRSAPKARPMKLAYLWAYPLEQARIKSARAPAIALDNARWQTKSEPGRLRHPARLVCVERQRDL